MYALWIHLGLWNWRWTGDETYKVPAGPIEDFPDDWVCPQCAAGIEGIITEDE